MPLTGHSIIAGQGTPGSAGTFRAVDPTTGDEIGPEVSTLSTQQLTSATRAAAEAFPVFRATSPNDRASFLEAIAEEIEAILESTAEDRQTVLFSATSFFTNFNEAAFGLA